MAKVIRIKNLEEGFQSLISTDKHTIVGDEPASANGTDKGMLPTEFLLAGIAFCKVATIRGFARKKGWDIGEITSEFVQEAKATEEGMETVVTSKIKFEKELTEEQKVKLLKRADACFVHRMIEGKWDIQNAEELR